MNGKNYGRNDMVLKRPASAYCHRWRDGTPIGTGTTGALFYGGVASEHLILNRGDLWYSGKDAPVPDVTDALQTMRDLEAQGKDGDACYKMYQALKARGYGTTLADMRALGEVVLDFYCNGVYRDYRRVLHLDTAEAEITYALDKTNYRRRYFASRKRDIIVMEMQSDEQFRFRLRSGFFHSFEGGRELTAKKSDAESAVYRVDGNCYIYASQNDGKYFGIAVRVISDGKTEITTKGIGVENARSALVLIKAFSACENLDAAVASAVSALQACNNGYDALFAENLPLYQRLYTTADLQLCDGGFRSNEELVSDAMQTQLSPELAEKLWRFGRYLFISGTGKGGLPFPLYGLWPCGYERQFTHNVANENVQSIYWHTDVGGLSELVVPLVDYYYKNMETYRENARKLYGCRGIFVGTYTTPQNAAVAWWVPVILHFVGVAGWLSSHFYRYYQFSGDEALFREKILPFMVEAATFYEDYHYFDKNGVFTLYPAVSPENSPMEFYDKTQPHSMPVTKNPTVEIAILKELLTNLLQIAQTHPELNDRVAVWEKMLSNLPEYRVNKDGAIAEWIDEKYSDAYDHRHVSHLYPVFPATEIEDSDDRSLLPAFKRALDLREKGSFCGWSMPHMSAIYSRMGEAEESFNILNALGKVCLLENFFTLGHDYRDMGITGFECGGENSASVQLDALLGAVNALQEMLLFATPKRLRLLPACPNAFSVGKATLRFTTGVVEFSWDTEKRICHGEVRALRDTDISLELPFGEKPKMLQLKTGEVHKF